MIRVALLIIVFTFFSCEKNDEYILETIIFPDLSGTLNIYSGVFGGGESITLEAYPNEFFEFISWSGSESSNSPIITFIMNENKLIYAEFRKKDSDGDGISDDIDLCNDTPLGLLVNNEGCTSLQSDYDNDGVINELDICPNTSTMTSVSNNGCPLIYLDENGVTLKATDEAIDSIGKTVLFEGDSVIIISDWNHMRSLIPSTYSSKKKLVTTFLEETKELCALPCQIDDNFDQS